MTTIKIVPTSEIWPPEAVLRGGVININRTVVVLIQNTFLARGFR